jgi:hypothetical protein
MPGVNVPSEDHPMPNGRAPAPNGSAPAPAPSPDPDGPQAAVLRTVREVEQHVASAGWDAPVRLFALIRTADALRRDPALVTQLPPDVVSAARADDHHLTAVEQEDLPSADSLEELLAKIAWPRTVDGAALVTERVMLPPSVEAELPKDTDEALRMLSSHPLREDVRIAAAVMRDGTRACALRVRSHDDDLEVALGIDLVPGLVDALASTLRP